MNSGGYIHFAGEISISSAESVSPLGLSLCDFSSRQRKDASQAAHRQQRPKGRKKEGRKEKGSYVFC